MKRVRSIFFAQPVDFVEHRTLYERVNHLKSLLTGLPVQIITPYLDEDLSKTDEADKTITQEDAKRIVQKDFATIDKCEIFLADLSREDRQAIGMIYEMAYAFSNEKTIIVHTKGSKLGKRIWIIACSDFVCETWEDVKKCISQICSTSS